MNWLRRGSATLLGGVFLFSGTVVSGETLTEAIAEIIQTNPEVKAQSYNRLGRDQEVVQARSGYLPTLDFSVGAGVEDFQEPVNDSFNPVEMRLSLRQNIFAGFATANEVERQQARVRSAAYSLQGISENTALRATRVYLDVLRQLELKDLAEENLVKHQRIADQIKLRSQAGVGSQVDTEQVEGRLALAQSNVVVTGTNLIDAKTNYRSVIGRLPGQLTKPSVTADSFPVSLDEAERWAVEKHPVLKSAEADLEARYKQRDVAGSPYLPILDFELDQEWEEEVDGFSGKQQSTTAMVRLRYNLFNGLKDRGRKAETVQLVEEAREIRNNTYRQVLESINLSWMAHQSAVERSQYLASRVESTRAATESFAQQFSLNKRSLLDVLDSEAEAVNARRDLINAEYDGLYAQYRILSGIGGLVPALGLQWPEESRVDDQNSEKDTKVASN